MPRQGKEVFYLMTKPSFQGERGEVINKCEASSLAEAIVNFAQIKQLPPDELIKLFRVK
tara:strand:- start:337 stop:513 length:177 start_codon:yes stop_codon:yes gene_type:complete